MRLPRASALGLGAALVALASSVGPAFADKIDGDWCLAAKGQSLSIDGQAITTPSGTNTTGDYTRHSFRYLVPDGDPGAGDEIRMRQLNEQTMVLRRPNGREETWSRCAFQTS